MGFKSKAPKAAVWIPKDTQFGGLSVDEIRAKHAANLEACNKANMATWPAQNSLTAAQIKTLDGTFGVEKNGARDAIGTPKSLVSKQPRGYKSGESKGESE
jgi:hypothetical protein